jgi:hypothetical protein
MTISDSPYLRSAAIAGAILPIGFGINAILRPDDALTFFKWEAPTSGSARDIFLGVVIYIAAHF